MGLFTHKPAQQQPTDDAQAAADQVFDEQYREELRQLGREHFKKLLEDATAELKSDVSTTLQHVTVDIRDYMTRQLDVTIAQLNSEITSQLNERISEYRRTATEAQDLANQSLSRNAEAVHQKYLQLTSTLQQTVTSHEVMMITTFEDNKARVMTAQKEQDSALRSLHNNVEVTRQKAEQLSQSMEKSVTDQARLLTNIYHENMARVSATKDAQESAYATMRDSIQSLQQQYSQLGALLDKSVADHKSMLTDVINQNMAQIIEHYLVGALGERSELTQQLPAILEQLEQNKQAMVDDMQL